MSSTVPLPSELRTPRAGGRVSGRAVLPSTELRTDLFVEAAADMDSPRDVVRVFAALSDVNRYRIVQLLSADGAEFSCGAIARALGLSPSLLSHHLGVLSDAGIIERRRDGFWTLNRLRRDELARRLAGLQRLMTPPGSEAEPAVDEAI